MRDLRRSGEWVPRPLICVRGAFEIEGGKAIMSNLGSVYYKTEAGLDEMQRRQAGLNPRVRQLLILIDGKRSVVELRKMIAVEELGEFLALLELKGLIAKREDDYVRVDAPGQLAFAGRAYAGQEGASVAKASHELEELDFGDSAILDHDFEEFKRDRSNLGQVLSDTVGPMGDELGVRIANATKRSELAELFVASLTVVELMAGRKAVDRFVEKMKALGWEN